MNFSWMQKVVSKILTMQDLILCIHGDKQESKILLKTKLYVHL